MNLRTIAGAIKGTSMIAAVFVTLGTLLAPTVAQAQMSPNVNNVCITGWGIDSFGAPPRPGAGASTYPCNNQSAFDLTAKAGTPQVELWAMQRPHSEWECFPATSWDGQACKMVGYGASPTARMKGHYGPVGWEGRHWWIEPSGQFRFAGLTFSTSTGHVPPQDPSTPECEYNWNNESENWELDWCPSPILMPTGKRGVKKDLFRMTSAENGVIFDIDGDGDFDQVSWTNARADVAFLALDRNGNGTIDDGTELFGNYTLPGVRNGFAALEQLARGTGPVIADLDSSNHLYAKLLLWSDRNHNGISERDELEPLSKYYTSIGLSYSDDKTVDRFGNQFKYKGVASVRTGPGRNMATSRRDELSRLVDIYDVFLVTVR
jgi:hypothetical protein